MPPNVLPDLGDMPPRAALHDVTSGGVRDTKASRKFSIAYTIRSQCAHLAHIVLLQARDRNLLATGNAFRVTVSSVARAMGTTLRVPDQTMVLTAGCTPLGHPIGHVVCSASQKEMVGPATTWIIATVKNIQSIRDRANGIGIGQTMRTAVLVTNREDTIPSAACAACPLPAPLTFRNATPELLGCIALHKMTASLSQS